MLDDLLFIENLGTIDETGKSWDHDNCAKVFINSIAEKLYNPNMISEIGFNDLLR